MPDTAVNLRDLESDFVTRRQGDLVRKSLEKTLAGLAPADRLRISLAGIGTMTPSFADECFGKLLLSLGESHFRSRIVLSEADEVTRTLLNVVLSKRAHESNSAQSARRA